jgi:hypothetical protein
MYTRGRDDSIETRTAGVWMPQSKEYSDVEVVMAKQVVVYSQPG